MRSRESCLHDNFCFVGEAFPRSELDTTQSYSVVDISEAEADMDIDKAAIIAALKDRQTVDPESMDPKILHRNGGTPVELPITSATLSGIRREGRDRGRGQRNGLTWKEVERICAVQEADGTLRGLRNSAILRVMSDGLLRISEVTELRISDLEDSTLRIRFSKTNQEGQGEHLYLCEDTRKIVAEWLERSGLTEGYLFQRMTARGDNLYRDKDTGEPHKLTDDGVRKIIKSCAAKVGLTEKVSGHSLRIGTTVSLAKSSRSVDDPSSFDDA